jgi:protein gp37
MAETTIEWTSGPRGEIGYTFNGWIGCTKVSDGCLNCYAEQQDKFRSWTPEGWGAGKPRRRTSKDNWDKPLRWNKAAAAAGERRKVFCSSLADVFDNEVPDGWRVDLFRLIRDTPNLNWLLLTKRIGNAARMIAETLTHIGGIPEPVPIWPARNVWLGATVVNQEEADRDIPKLLEIPAQARFLSMEPLLGPVNLHEFISNDLERRCPRCGWRGRGARGSSCGNCGLGPEDGPLHWVIVGGESGRGARPLELNWIRDIVKQCKAAGVPVLVKQLGQYVLDDGMSSPGEHWPITTVRESAPGYASNIDPDATPFVIRLHDRNGGDWQEWPEDLRVREFPEVACAT